MQGPHLSPNSRPRSSPSPFSAFSRKATPDCKGAWETASVWAAMSPGSTNLGKKSGPWQSEASVGEVMWLRPGVDGEVAPPGPPLSPRDRLCSHSSAWCLSENSLRFCLCSWRMPSISSAGSSLSTTSQSYQPAPYSSSKSAPSASLSRKRQEPPVLRETSLPPFWGSPQPLVCGRQAQRWEGLGSRDRERTTPLLTRCLQGPSQGSLANSGLALAHPSSSYPAPLRSPGRCSSSLCLPPLPHPAVRPPPLGPTAVNPL